ncbi:nicotinate (nicotinamide) nucleotide adenylyltransferase [Desulfolithobacter sp.]
MEKDRQVGVFGGTFDPVHEGHLRIAEAVLACTPLDLLLFVPAYLPPHKHIPVAPFHHRVAMLELALGERSRSGWLGFGEVEVAVSRIEAELKTPSYTIDTLKELEGRLGPAVFHLVIGADSLVELHLWYRYREILQRCHLLVAARPGISPAAVQDAITRLPGGYVRQGSANTWRSSIPGSKMTITYLDSVLVPVSSTRIRQELAAGRRPAMVPPVVLEYIEKQGLYRCQKEESGD